MSIVNNLTDKTVVLWIVLCALIAGIGYGVTLKPAHPQSSDDSQYLAVAYHLLHHHTFSEAPTTDPVPPSLGREPGYGFFLAGLMAFAPGLSAFTPDCFQASQHCSSNTYWAAQRANILFVIASVFILYKTLRLLGGTPLGGLATAIFLLANTDMMKSRPSVISDYLAFFLVACALWGLAWAFMQPHRRLRWAFAGLLLAALTLTKAIFFVFTFAAIGVAFMGIFFRGGKMRRAFLISLAVFTMAYVVPVGGWMTRNAAISGSLVLTQARGGIALSTREVFNHMSLPQYVCAFVYWTRGFGDNLATNIFPPEVWQPFQTERPGAFYDYGQNRYAPRINTLMAERHLTRPEAERLADREMIDAILDKPFMHILTTLPLFYRGIWIDEFILFTFPALVWMSLATWRQRKFALMAVVSMGWFNLVFYALASLNISRYQITAVPVLALCGGFAFDALLRHWALRRSTVHQPKP